MDSLRSPLTPDVRQRYSRQPAQHLGKEPLRVPYPCPEHRARHTLGTFAFLVALALSAVGCAHRLAVDYNFEASGSVVDPSGAPLPGVRVTVEVSADMYEVITPFRQAVETTHEDGSFSFFFLSEAPNPPYTLLFEKAGFKTVVIEGAIREMNPHRVILEPELPQPPASPVQRPQ